MIYLTLPLKIAVTAGAGSRSPRARIHQKRRLTRRRGVILAFIIQLRKRPLPQARGDPEKYHHEASLVLPAGGGDPIAEPRHRAKFYPQARGDPTRPHPLSCRVLPAAGGDPAALRVEKADSFTRRRGGDPIASESPDDGLRFYPQARG